MLREHAHAISNIRKAFNVAISCCSFWLAYTFRTSDLFGNGSALRVPSLLPLVAPIAVIWWFTLHGFYRSGSQRFEQLPAQTVSLIKNVGVSVIILLATWTLLKVNFSHRSVIALFAVINVALLLVEQLVVNTVSSLLRSGGRNTRRVLIVGDSHEATRLIRTLRQHPRWGLDILGVIMIDALKFGYDDQGKWGYRDIDGCRVLGTTQDFEKIIDDTHVDYVFFAVPARFLKHAQPLLVLCAQRGINTKMAANFLFQEGHIQPSVDTIGNLHILSFNTVMRDPYQLFVKEAIDRVVALAGLILLSPVFVTTALAIKLDSRGPVFFRQKRVGINGREFEILKFRSMVANAEYLKAYLSAHNEVTGPAFKMSNDPRVTRVGRFIRKTSIDELPQLFNVLLGDMSLVGPRPPLPSEVKQYNNWQRRRLSVKPGITCTWQVSGRNNIDFDTWMKMDLAYIDRWSLLNDVKLLFKTMPAVLLQKGVK